MDNRLENLVNKFREKGYRITPQRIAILKIFAENTEHLSVEQVYERVKTDFPMTSLATVYKTVVLLKEEGEVLELAFGNGSSRYDVNKPYPHPHLVCIECHRIIDTDFEIADEVPQQLSNKYGYQILNHRVDFFGVCPACQAAKSFKKTKTRMEIEK